jgi:hypothetical protein
MLLQDAKRHGQEVCAILLDKHGGLLASDPKLVELKKVGLKSQGQRTLFFFEN